jgi:GNAT superfamily N-acetyltransferase
MRIVPVDPADDAQLRAWHATYLASDTHQREHATPWMLEEVRAEMTVGGNGVLALAWSGVVDGQVVAVASAEMPQRDNRSVLWFDLHVHPEHRGRGHATGMLAHLEQVAHEHGRTLLQTETAFPYAAPADGAGQPAVEFLRRRGFEFGIGDVQRVLDLPADEELLRRLAAEAEPHHRDYAIRQFCGPVPSDIVHSFGELIGSLMTEAPTGAMEVEREVFDEDRIRADETKFGASGRTKYTTVAIARDGSVAAYSELVVPAHDPGRVYQWGTLAHPDHRGHRLGLATKTRNLLWLQQQRPDLKRLVTYNAEVNRHMIGVNEQMGFRPTERLGEFQKRLAAATA